MCLGAQLLSRELAHNSLQLRQNWRTTPYNLDSKELCANLHRVSALHNVGAPFVSAFVHVPEILYKYGYICRYACCKMYLWIVECACPSRYNRVVVCVAVRVAVRVAVCVAKCTSG